MAEDKLKKQITDSVALVPTKTTVADATTEDLVAHLSSKLKEDLNYSFQRKDWVEEVSEMFAELIARKNTPEEIFKGVYKARHSGDDD